MRLADLRAMTAPGGGGNGLADGDYGDVTVSDGGTAIELNPAAILHLPVVTASTPGIVPPTGGNPSEFLRADVQWETTPSGSALVLTEYEADLGYPAKYAGSFDITGLSGLVAGRQVLVQQKAAAYTGKGTLTDESELDQVSANGYAVNDTTVRVFWNCVPPGGPVCGNVKFGFAVSS
jgi:hypothetical protein